MLYLRMCFDREGAGDLRAQHLKTHREYIATFIKGRDGVKIAQAGPMLDDAEAGYRGSFLVLEAASLDDIRAFNAGDPFVTADLFDTIHLVPWERHIGNSSDERYVP